MSVNVAALIKAGIDRPNAHALEAAFNQVEVRDYIAEVAARSIEGALVMRPQAREDAPVVIDRRDMGCEPVPICAPTDGRRRVVLAVDVVNNNAVADTIADVTGLSFPVFSGFTYWFRAVIPYTSAATTTGSRWSINGPATTMLNYMSQYTLTATTQTVNYATAYNIPAASNATSLTAGNVAQVEGFVKPSADGTVSLRFASEVAASAITAKAGAILDWARVL